MKMSGAEFKAFYTDEEWWPAGLVHEDEQIRRNGQEVSVDDLDFWLLESVKDTDQIQILGGIVCYEKSGPTPGRLPEGCTMENYAKRWLKEQSIRRVVVELPKEQTPQLQSLVKSVGGKVIS